MSKLIDPALGDVLDRLTILSLKVQVGRERGTDVAHFEKEQTALLAKVRARDHSGPWFGHLLELATVNGLLWHAEDEMRNYRVHPGDAAVAMSSVAECGMRIQALNDRRAELIAAINKEAGEASPPEKLG